MAADRARENDGTRAPSTARSPSVGLGAVVARLFGRACPGATPLWNHALLALVVASVALGLRLHELGTESLWIDEAITHARASYDTDKLIRDSVRRKHIPTYFLMMHHLLPLVGDSEFAMRLPSAVFGAGAATITYAIGAALAGPIAGLSAGLLMATARSQIHYGQEARMYATVTLFASLGILAITLLTRDDHRRSRPPWRLRPSEPHERTILLAWMLLTVGTVGPLYLHNTAVFYVAGMQVAGACMWLITSGNRWGFARNWILCQGLSLLCWSPWIPHLVAQSHTFNRWKQRRFTWDMAGDHVSQLLLLDQPSGLVPWLFALACACAVAAPGPARRRAWVLMGWPLAGLGICAAISLHKANMMFVRTLLWTAIPTFALVGAGLARMPYRSGVVGLGLLMWLNADTVRDYYQATTKPPWREYMQLLTQRTDAQSTIVGTGASRFVRYYQQRKHDPLPARPVVHFNRQKRIEEVVGDAKEFWWLAKTNSTKTKRFQQMLRRSRRYKRVFRQKQRSALLSRYKLRKRRRNRH